MEFRFSRLLLALFLYAALLHAQEDASACLANCMKELDEAVAKKVDVELLAMQNRMEYPVSEPSMPLADAYKEALRMVEAKLQEEADVKSEDELIRELGRQYAPFKVGERITIVQNLKYAKTITGRYQEIDNQGHVHVGKYWIRIEDLDKDTAARFNPVECEALIKKKVQQALQKQKVLLEGRRRAEIMKTVPLLLNEKGYSPKNDDRSSPSFLNVDNWESQANRLRKLVDAEKAKVKETMEEGFVEKYMTSHGFRYDDSYNDWCTPEEYLERRKPKPKPKKEGTFQNLKKIFSK